MRTPAQVRIAIGMLTVLLICSIVQEWPLLTLLRQHGSSITAALGITVFNFAIELFLFFKIWTGRNWARASLAILLVAGFLNYGLHATHVVAALGKADTARQFEAMLLALVYVGALMLLYSQTSNRWFRGCLRGDSDELVSGMQDHQGPPDVFNVENRPRANLLTTFNLLLSFAALLLLLGFAARPQLIVLFYFIERWRAATLVVALFSFAVLLPHSFYVSDRARVRGLVSNSALFWALSPAVALGVMMTTSRLQNPVCAFVPALCVASMAAGSVGVISPNESPVAVSSKITGGPGNAPSDSAGSQVNVGTNPYVGSSPAAITASDSTSISESVGYSNMGQCFVAKMNEWNFAHSDQEPVEKRRQTQAIIDLCKVVTAANEHPHESIIVSQKASAAEGAHGIAPVPEQFLRTASQPIYHPDLSASQARAGQNSTGVTREVSDERKQGSPPPAGGVYRCTSANGETTFSGSPCGPDAKLIEVKPASPGTNYAPSSSLAFQGKASATPSAGVSRDQLISECQNRQFNQWMSVQKSSPPLVAIHAMESAFSSQCRIQIPAR